MEWLSQLAVVCAALRWGGGVIWGAFELLPFRFTVLGVAGRWGVVERLFEFSLSRSTVLKVSGRGGVM